jgi:coenzyme F420 hydrogenase subunit beta
MLTLEPDPTKQAAAFRQFCTDCGISRTAQTKRCARACQFINPNYDALEVKVHGRRRGQADPISEPASEAGDPSVADEIFFGPMQAMYRARLHRPREGAQWTGITTALAEALLEQGLIDAVITMKPDPDDVWKPVPVIVTEAKALAHCRGMRMGYAPLLALIEPALALGLRRLAVIGIPCQVYALRALQDDWERQGLHSLYVIGTPCSDNTHTARFHEFLALLDPQPATINYLEFRADYHVELRYNDGRRKLIPFLQLPLSDLPPDFFPITCKTCVDYSNVLSDITVGYMGGSGDQWLIVRNAKGRFMLDQLKEKIDLSSPAQAGHRRSAVRAFMENLQKAEGGLPLRRMPRWLRPIVAWFMPRVGPRGLEFARARIEMKAIETLITLRHQYPARVKSMVPRHVWAIAEAYGIKPQPLEFGGPQSMAANAKGLGSAAKQSSSIELKRQTGRSA